MIEDFIPHPFVIFLVTIILIVLYFVGYNELASALNAVKAARRHVASILSRRDVVPEDLLSIAELAGAHERTTQTDVAKHRGRKPSGPFRIGHLVLREDPPEITATPLYGVAQSHLQSIEAELAKAWKRWVKAARTYEDLRTTLPFCIVAWTFPTRFPKAFES